MFTSKMDLANKFMALTGNEREEELAFEQNLAKRKYLVDIVQKTKELSDSCNKLENDLAETKRNLLLKEPEVKLLNKELEVMKILAKERLTAVIEKEHKLRKMKDELKENIRSNVNKIQELRSKLRENETNKESAESDGSDKVNQRASWKADGEMEAIALYENYQRKREERMKWLEDKMVENDLMDLNS